MSYFPTVTLEGYEPNKVIEASSTVKYIGSEKANGAWLFTKVDTSSGTTLTYATVLNNPSVTSYTDALASYSSLTYGNYSTAF